MVVCAIVGCTSNHTTKVDGKRVRFFQVPAKEIKEWDSHCDATFSTSSFVCGIHFPTVEPGRKRPKGLLPSMSSNDSSGSSDFKVKYFALLQTVEDLKKDLDRNQMLLKKSEGMNLLKSNMIKKRDLEIVTYQRKVESLENQLKTQEEGLSMRFTESQRKIISQGTSKTWWNTEDILKGLQLKIYSAKAYETLRTIIKYPLPSKTTINRWISAIQIRPGVLHGALELLKAKLKEADNLSRVCCLTFDEVDIDPSYCYDKKYDQMFGESKHAAIFVARGIFSSWKMPIYLGFNEKFDKESINHLIEVCMSVGVQPVALTCDLGGSNRNFYKKVQHLSYYFVVILKFFFSWMLPHNKFGSQILLIKSQSTIFLTQYTLLNFYETTFSITD